MHHTSPSGASSERLDWRRASGDVSRSEIRSRGGRAALVRFPTADEIWQIDEQFYPRSQYWDPLAAIAGVPAVHFADYESLRRIPLGDGSHIDRRYAPEFTESLMDILIEKGVFEGT